MRNRFAVDKDSIVIVGGGAAGLMAAGTAASLGKKVVVFEKHETNGKKLLIAGKGRCNITNACDDVETLIANTPGNGNFLYSSFYTFSNQSIIDFFEERGLKTKVERGQRVFPCSDRSEDVLRVLEKYVRDNNGVIVNNAEVVKLVVEKNGQGRHCVTGVYVREHIKNSKNNDLTPMVKVQAKSIIVTTGGLSYPGTGSTGAGYDFARQVGHTIIEPKPSLIPLLAAEDWVPKLQGLSLRNVNVSFYDNESKKLLYSEQGEMLFTHYGVSGPVILSASRHLLDKNYRNVTMKIDLKPALDEKTLDNRLIRDFQKFSRKHFSNSLGDLLPQKLIPIVIELSGIQPDKQVDHITVEERKRLIGIMKHLTMSIVGARPIKEAIVTAGGVKTTEIDSSTMQSKLASNLYFAGEVIDVDAYTGGFNLTIAFSTAYLAALNV